MDPVSLVLGILGVFGTGAACYKTLSDAASTNGDATTLYWKLRIEEIRFKLWGRAWGVSPGARRSQLLEDALVKEPELAEVLSGVLQHVVSTLRDGEALRLRVVQAKERTSNAGSCAEDRSSLAEAGDRGPSLSWRKKMRWSISDKAEFTKLIESLKDFNDGLSKLLPLSARDSLERALPPEIMSSTEDLTSLLGIKEAAADHPVLQVTAALKSMSISIEEVPWTGTSIDRVSSLQLILGRVNFPDWLSRSDADASSLRIVTTYRDSEISQIQHVLIEMKQYDNNMSAEVRSQMLFRVDKLARLLHVNPKPPDARVLDCIGWVDHAHHPKGPCVGFVYKVPLLPPPQSEPSNISNFQPTSLQAILVKSKVQKQGPLLLGDRFQLSKVLVRAMLQFHAAGWLHKDFQSSNIIFFPQPKSQQSSSTLDIDANFHYQLSNPYITGFDYARPNNPNELSGFGTPLPRPLSTLRQHPAYILQTTKSQIQTQSTTRFKRAYDVYALGCILLEIGLWQSLDYMWKDKYSPEEFRQRLVQNWAGELGGRCGERYQRVVEGCLNADGEGEGDGDSEKLKDFVWEVVDQLEKLNV